MSEGYNASKILTWVLGIVGGLATLGVAASVAMLVSMGNRLANMEGAMTENRQERRAADADLKRRIERLEGRVYGEARE